jgi:hypothetical protein
MADIHPIMHNGRLAAVVAGRQAMIRDSVPDRDLPTIKAMCLYALEVADGRIPGPYSSAQALAYARAASAARN